MEYGLIGYPLGHSYSAQIHACLAQYPYTLCSVDRAQMETLLKKRDFKGLNVTIPYKQTVLDYVDELSEEASRISAVNTIVKDTNGRLIGHNTDLYGMKYMAAQAGVSLAGKKALILGSGGTSRTARAMLQDAGAAQILVVSRTGPIRYEDLCGHADAEVIVNTTPVGMYPHTQQSPVDLRAFPKLCCVLDVVYNPERTKLLLQAQRLGIPHAGGLGMLAAQAKYAAELFTGKAVRDAKIGYTVQEMRKRMLNLILIGMPGCGKTQTGKAAAELLGREAIDLDERMEQKFGKSAGELLEILGEDTFRGLETQVVAETGMLSGKVISTGGGVVVRQENLDLLRQNGVLIQLHRPLQNLAMEGRPLSADPESLKRLEQQRAPLYSAFADGHADNNADIQQAAKAVVEAFYEVIGN